MKFNLCNYCDNLMVIPRMETSKLIDKYIMRYIKRKCIHTLEHISVLAKLSFNIEYYLTWKYPAVYTALNNRYKFSSMPTDAVQSTIRLFLHSYKDAINSTCIACNYCKMESCNFHLTYGGFEFFRCSNEECSDRLVVCGWCLANDNSIIINKKCLSCRSFRRVSTLMEPNTDNTDK